jgi:hypothetical protein
VRTPLTRQGSENPVHYFPWAAAANEKRHLDSHYPTQAEGRLEWGTQLCVAVVAKNYRVPISVGTNLLLG